MMSRALRAEDLLELSKIYEVEFNKPELHDRVLVFDVMRDVWENYVVLTSTSCMGETNEASQTTEAEGQKTEIEPQTAIINEMEGETTTSEDSVEESEKDDPAEMNSFVQNESANTDTGSSFNSESCEQSDSTDQNRVVEKGNESNGKILRQHQFFIHGSWLALQSSYFRSLLFSGMKESTCKEVHIKISESEEIAHLLLLEALYKVDILDGADVDGLLAVLLLAHKYDAKFVFKKCKYCLQVAKLSLEVCESMMSFIHEHSITDVDDLAATLQSFLAKEFSPLDKTWQTTSFENLSQPLLRHLLSSDKLVTQTENTVFHALMHWVARNPVDNEHVASLLSVVRFELMPIDYLYNVVQHHPIATTMPEFSQRYLTGVTYHALTTEIKKRLTVKPVNRQAPAEDVVQFTWIIHNDEVDKVVSIGDELKSDPFWCCGYKMQLSLKKVSIQNTYPQYIRHTGCLGLEILGLNNESVVRLQWTPVIQSFNGKSAFNAEQTFNAELQTSSLVVCFNIKKQTDQSSAQVSSFSFESATPSVLFNGTTFGSSTTPFSFGTTSNPPVKSPSSTGISPFSGKAPQATPSPFVVKSGVLPSLSIDLKVKLN